MASKEEWRDMSGKLYFFIQRHCTPSGMTPDAAWRILEDYIKMAREDNG